MQLHVVGYSYDNGRWHDYHSESIQDDLRRLIDLVIKNSNVQARVIERDGNFPEAHELVDELCWLESELARD